MARVVQRIVSAVARSRRRAPGGDFRTPAEVAADLELVGTWWRCQVHGQVADALILGGVAYCPDERCGLVVIVVASGQAPHQGTADFGWMRGGTATRRQAPVARYSARGLPCGKCRLTIPPQALHVAVMHGDSSCDLCAACARATGDPAVLAVLEREGA